MYSRYWDIFILYGHWSMELPQLYSKAYLLIQESDRFQKIIEKYKITQFYTASTAIRSLGKEFVEQVEKHDLSSLRMWEGQLTMNHGILLLQNGGCGYSHEIKGNALYGFVTLKESGEYCDRENWRKEINIMIADSIGPIAKLDKIQFEDKLPKTCSGRIMEKK